MEPTDYEYLYRRFKERKCTSEEVENLLVFFQCAEGEYLLARYISEELEEKDSLVLDTSDQSILEKNRMSLRLTVRRQSRSNLRYKMIGLAAAIVLMIFGFWVILHTYREDSFSITSPLTINLDILDSIEGPALIFPNGKQLLLDKHTSGIIVHGDEVFYDNGKKINIPFPISFLTLANAAGQVYSVTMADGSSAVLNAQSCVKFPLAFEPRFRRVEVVGEAFFKVAASRTQPFYVVSKNQEIQVLGTQFNVNAYNDEPTVTTLLSGSVQVAVPAVAQDNQRVQLLPGEQTILQQGDFIKETVHVEEFVAWKEGFFYFNNTPFKSMISQVSRWYDLKVSYENTIPQATFSGKMTKGSNLNHVLKLLDAAGISYLIEEKRLIIK